MYIPKKSKKYFDFLETIKGNTVRLFSGNNQVVSLVRFNATAGLGMTEPIDNNDTNCNNNCRNCGLECILDPSGLHEDCSNYCSDDCFKECGQQWIFYPVDGGKYIIVNKFFGGVMDIIPAGLVELRDYTGDVSQFWTLETVEQQLSCYRIRNFSTGALLTPDGKVTATVALDDPSTYWTIQAYQPIYVPSAPNLEELDPYPKMNKDNYNDINNFPDTTPKRLTGWSLLPAPLVKDGNRSEQQKLQQSPYYILEKYQYWKRLIYSSLEGSQEYKTTVRSEYQSTGKQELDQTTGITLSKDLGFNFLGLSASKKEEIRTTLHIHESQTLEQRTDQTNSDDYRNPFTKVLNYVKYILVTEIVLLRPSPTDQNPDVEISHITYTDPNVVLTSAYSLAQEPSDPCQDCQDCQDCPDCPRC